MIARRHERLAAAVLVAVFGVLGAFVFRPGVVDFDGAAHYAYLPSAIIDGNLEFVNGIVPPEAVSITPAGRVGNVHPVGPAILWAPAFLSAHVFCRTLGAENTALCRDGFTWPYVSAISVASALYGFGGLYIVYRILRRLFDIGPAFSASLAVWLASPLLAYMFIIPSMPHAISFGVAAAFLAMWWIVPARPSLAGWFIWGQIGGVLTVVRWQDVIWVVLPLSVALFELGPSLLARREMSVPAVRLALARFAWFVLGLVLVFSPQMVTWNLLYGSPLTIPQGPTFMQWTSPMLGEVLFSARHGLFTWMPLALAACAGILLVARRHLKLFIPLVVILLMDIYVNSAVSDWWGGGAYGPRRFVSVLPVLVLGLAALFQRAWAHRAIRFALLLASCICIIGNWILMTEFYTALIQPDQALTWTQALTIAVTQNIPLDRWMLLYPGIVGQWHKGPYGTPAATLFFLMIFLLLGAATTLVIRWASGRSWAPGRRPYAVALAAPLAILIVDVYLWRLG